MMKIINWFPFSWISNYISHIKFNPWSFLLNPALYTFSTTLFSIVFLHYNFLSYDYEMLQSGLADWLQLQTKTQILPANINEMKYSLLISHCFA